MCYIMQWYKFYLCLLIEFQKENIMMQKPDIGCIMQWMGIIMNRYDRAVVSIFFLCYSDHAFINHCAKHYLALTHISRNRKVEPKRRLTQSRKGRQEDL